MNVGHSITPKSEKLTNVKLKSQWNSIDWKKVEKHVNRLQTRIAKAVKQGKWFLVKRLQYLLTHSYYAKLLSVRNVSQNKGKRTAGIDGETWSSPEAKMKAALNLTNNGYVAKPLKRVYIEKSGSKKKRPLGIPTMFDRAMQALYALALSPIAETTSDHRSFGSENPEALRMPVKRHSRTYATNTQLNGYWKEISKDASTTLIISG